MLELMRQVHRQRIHQEDRAQRANALAELHVRPLIHSPPSSTALHCTSLTRHVPSVRAEQHEHTPHTPHARGTQNACSVAQSLTDARPRRTTNRLDACGCCCRQSGALRVARTSAFCARGLRALHFAAFYCTIYSYYSLRHLFSVDSPDSCANSQSECAQTAQINRRLLFARVLLSLSSRRLLFARVLLSMSSSLRVLCAKICTRCLRSTSHIVVSLTSITFSDNENCE